MKNSIFSKIIALAQALIDHSNKYINKRGADMIKQRQIKDNGK